MRRSTSAQLSDRMLEPVAQALMHRLMVPKVYFHASWPRDQKNVVDMVLVDRSGTGDVHLVQVKGSARSALAAGNMNRLIELPANYLWLAFPKPRRPIDYASQALYPEDGAGRIGIIEVVQMEGDTLRANIAWPAERFHERLQDEAAAFVRSHRPDISFR